MRTLLLALFTAAITAVLYAQNPGVESLAVGLLVFGPAVLVSYLTRRWP